MLTLLLSTLTACAAATNIVNAIFLNDPAIDVITALEEEDYVLALMLAHEIEHDSLLQRLENRLEILESDFRTDNKDFIVIMEEIRIIDAMNVQGLSNTLHGVSNRIQNLNSSRIAFRTAESMFNNGDFPSAIAQLRLVIPDDANYELALRNLQHIINAYRYQILEIADESVARGDYSGAIFAINNGLWTLVNDPVLMERLNLSKQALVNSAISNARASADIGDYDIAIFGLNVALQAAPNNEQLTRLIDEINNIRPMNLLALEPVNSQFWNPNETKTEIILRYESPWGHRQRSEAYFFVDAGYSILRGTINADEHLRPETRMQIRIFADDVLVYESGYIQRASTFDFEANITGARFIRLRVDNRHYSFPDTIPAWGGRVTASNVFLIR